ncbi:MAG: hypothetical protein JXB48_19245, partial [Candidatus Latescibacteria bacterium]|nr:hypothetical protein [Candidatus Latescibacterota bacterium]
MEPLFHREFILRDFRQANTSRPAGWFWLGDVGADPCVCPFMCRLPCSVVRTMIYMIMGLP